MGCHRRVASVVPENSEGWVTTNGHEWTRIPEKANHRLRGWHGFGIKDSENFRHLKNSSALIFLIACILAFAGPISGGHAASEQKASYGTRVKYRVGQKIELPDFVIEFVGERRQSVSAYPRGFLYYDFKVRNANVEKVVSWSSGTGDIGPVAFEIGGKRFLLELRASDKLGKLEENELVIWKSGDASL